MCMGHTVCMMSFYIHLYRVLRTFHVATNGTTAVYMYSPSEVHRLALLKCYELVNITV